MRILVWLSAGLVLVAVVLLWWFQPPVAPRGEAANYYPWQVEANPDGTSRVLGLALGEATLGVARERFGDRMQLALFRAPEGDLSLEAFYSELTLGGLTARVILSASLPEAQLDAMRERARDREQLDNGALRYQLIRDDLQAAMSARITGLTYLPAADLDEDLVRRRFGQPEDVLIAADGARHFLYPARGLDLVLAPNGDAALQYVPPRDFERLRRPLRPSGDR